jgi:hypothetical protein
MMRSMMSFRSSSHRSRLPSEEPGPPSARPQPWKREGGLSLVLSAVCPFVAFQLLTSRGIPDVPALAVAAIFPAIGTLVGWMRAGRPDLVGLGSLALIALTITLSMATANPLFILLKGSAIGGIAAAICVASLGLSRPVMFYVTRHFASIEDPAQAARFDSLWQGSSPFRRTMRWVTLVWGVGLAGEALLRIALVMLLPTGVFLVASKLTGFGVTLALVAWTMTAVREAARPGRITSLDQDAGS